MSRDRHDYKGRATDFTLHRKLKDKFMLDKYGEFWYVIEVNSVPLDPKQANRDLNIAK